MEDKHFTDCGCDRSKRINGIKCDACNCVYNNEKCECCAGQVCIGPKNADCSAHTSCATFKPRAY